MGYPVRYPIPSGLIPRDDIDKSSLNTIPLKRYRDEILMEYPVRRYIFEIVSRGDIFVGYPNGG